MVLLELLTLASVAYACAGCISSARTSTWVHELEKREKKNDLLYL